MPAIIDPLENTSNEHSRKRRRTSLREQDPAHHSLRSACNSLPLSKPSAHRLDAPALPASPAPAPVLEEAACDAINERRYIIDYWMRKGSWPKKYFEQDQSTGNDFENLMDSTTRAQCLAFASYDPDGRLLFSEKAPAALSRKRSGSNSSTPSFMLPPSMPPPSMSMTPNDQRLREEKSAPSSSSQYQSELDKKGFIHEEVTGRY